MKRKNTFTLLIISTIIITSFSFAYGQGGRPQGRQGGGMGRQFTEEDVKNRVKRLSQDINMTEEQEKQITEFEVAAYKKNMVERQKNQGDWEKMRTYMMEQRELRNEKYKEVLTEEQYKNFENLQNQRRQDMQNRRPQFQQQNPGQGPGQRPGGQNNQQRPPRGRGGQG